MIADLATIVLLLCGAFFFLAGTVGVVRFPDALARLHAVTKADNVGLGFIVFALALQAGSLLAAAKFVVIWGLVLVASATSGFLVARHAVRYGSDAGPQP